MSKAKIPEPVAAYVCGVYCGLRLSQHQWMRKHLSPSVLKMVRFDAGEDVS